MYKIVNANKEQYNAKSNKICKDHSRQFVFNYYIKRFVDAFLFVAKY